jgi:hypothetical protein
MIVGLLGLSKVKNGLRDDLECVSLGQFKLAFATLCDSFGLFAVKFAQIN